MHPYPKKGLELSPSLVQSPVKVDVQGAELEYTSQSWAAPTMRIVSHMGPKDTNSFMAAGTSGGSGTAGGAVMGVGVG